MAMSTAATSKLFFLKYATDLSRRSWLLSGALSKITFFFLPLVKKLICSIISVFDQNKARSFKSEITSALFLIGFKLGLPPSLRRLARQLFVASAIEPRITCFISKPVLLEITTAGPISVRSIINVEKVGIGMSVVISRT